MPTANPYASYLDGRPVLDILADSPIALASIFATLTPAQATHSPAPAKWSPLEVLCHLADCEIAHGFRLRQTATLSNPLLEPFDQDLWAIGYRSHSVTEALALFTSLRNWNLAFVAALPPGSLARTAHHPERGDLTLQILLDTMAGHDLNHITRFRDLL